MSKIDNFNEVKQKIEFNSMDFLNKAKNVAFRATENEMHWILDINDSQYNVLYYNNIIQVYQVEDESAFFYLSQIDEFKKYVSSLTNNLYINNNYETIQSLTSSSNYYDLDIIGNEKDLLIHYPNDVKVLAIVSDSQNVVYNIGYLEDSMHTSIPICIKDEKLQIDNMRDSYVDSLENVGKIVSQIGSIDKLDLSEKMMELREERVEDVRSKLMDVVSAICDSPDNVNFYVARDFYGIRLDAINDSNKYSIVVDNEVIEVYKNNEFVEHFKFNEIDKIKEVVELAESLRVEANESSIQEIHDKLMIATSDFYTHSDGIKTQIDKDAGTIRIDYYLDFSNSFYEEQVNMCSFVLKNNVIEFYEDNKLLGQWPVDKMYEMSKEVDMSSLGNVGLLRELPSSLTNNASSYTINIDVEDFYPQTFSIKYDNDLLLTGFLNKDGSVDYNLFIESKSNDSSINMSTPIMLEDNKLCVVDNNSLAKVHVSSIDELGESISKVSGLSSSKIEEVKDSNGPSSNAIEDALREFDKETNINEPIKEVGINDLS